MHCYLHLAPKAFLQTFGLGRAAAEAVCLTRRSGFVHPGDTGCRRDTSARWDRFWHEVPSSCHTRVFHLAFPLVIVISSGDHQVVDLVDKPRQLRVELCGVRGQLQCGLRSSP